MYQTFFSLQKAFSFLQNCYFLALPAEKMDAPVKDEDMSSSSDLIVLAGNPVTNDATITEPSGKLKPTPKLNYGDKYSRTYI